MVLTVLVLGVFAGFFYLISLATPDWRDATFTRFVAFVFFVITAHRIKAGKVLKKYGFPGTIHIKDRPSLFWIVIAVITAFGLLLFLTSEPQNSILRDFIHRVQD